MQKEEGKYPICNYLRTPHYWVTQICLFVHWYGCPVKNLQRNNGVFIIMIIVSIILVLCTYVGKIYSIISISVIGIVYIWGLYSCHSCDGMSTYHSYFMTTIYYFVEILLY